MGKEEALALLADRHSTRQQLEDAAAEMEDWNFHEVAALLRSEARNRA